MQIPALGRQSQRTGGARDKRHPKRLLETLDALADRRWRNRQRPGGGRDPGVREVKGAAFQTGDRCYRAGP